MIREIAFLCFVGASSAFSLNPLDWFSSDSPTKAWERDLKVRFSVNPISIYDNKAFMHQPLTKDEAVKAGWVRKTPPDAHANSGYSSLVLYGPENDHTLGMYYEDTVEPHDVMGWQICMDVDLITDNYDWKIQGFSTWTTDINGKSILYQCTFVYLCSPEYLLKDAATRIATRNPSKLVQDQIYVSGFNGEMYPISTNASVITNPETSDFTKQACTPGMGDHYYFNMTKQQVCSPQTLFPYFVLVYKGQVVGIGFVGYMNMTIKDGATNYFENPFRLAVKVIVPEGPECMYNLADNPGRVTIHFYLMHNPAVLTCLDDLNWFDWTGLNWDWLNWN